MMRLTIPAVVLASLLSSSIARAEEPHLDFVRGLRERGYHDLALEYLRGLEKRPDTPLPADLQALLPLEIARCEAEAGLREREPAERERLLSQARAHLKAAASNPANSQGVLGFEAVAETVRLELENARGKALRAKFLVPAAERDQLQKEALAALDEAVKTGGEAVRKMEDLLRKSDDRPKAERDRLLSGYLNTLLLTGQAHFERAGMLPAKDAVKSGEALVESSRFLEKLADYKDRHPLGWIGLAWVGRVNEEADTAKSKKAYDTILGEKRVADAAAAQRLVKLFRLESELGKAANKQARQAARSQAENWLSEYATTANTREGQHARFLLAQVYLRELEELSPAGRRSPAGQSLVDRVLAQAEQLELAPGEYPALASALRFQAIRVSGRASSRPIAELKSFDECLLRAEMEAADAAEAAAKAAKTEDPKEKEDLQKQLVTAQNNLLEASRRAVDLMPETVKDDEWERAYRYLYNAYRGAGQHAQAAIVLEHVARSSRRPATAKTYASLALRLYQGLYGSSRSPADLDRLTGLAEFVVQRWPNDPETDSAREILGFALFQQRKMKEAAALYAHVSPQSPGYAASSYRAGALYWALHAAAMREAKRPLTAQSPEADLAVQMLDRAVKAFDALKQPSPADQKLAVVARVELAEILAQRGQTDQVLALINPLVDRLEKKQLPPDLPPGYDVRLLSQALQASVQKQDSARAVKVLDTLQKINTSGELGGGLAEQLRALGRQIRDRIAVLEQQGDAAKLKETRETFTNFLGYLEKDPKLTPDLRLWVGTSYQSLGQHSKAAQLFGAIPDPGPNAKPEEAQIYRRARLLYLAALRQAAAATDDPKERSERFALAQRELDAVMKLDWAKRNMEFIKERILLLQDQERVSGPDGAIARWDQLIKALEPNLDKGAHVKTAYYDAQYNRMICMYIEAKKLKGSDQEKALRRVAAVLAPLRRNDYGGPEFKVRFEAFLNDPARKDLRDAWEKLQRESGSS
jgi:hypothetical protein